ncbi:AsmA family protein [Daejeonella lutea]|uniref:DUF748 domain-containing protein n=1 Tax=Daejeonella lutea TaxID=572036 RepID=A0A1T5DYB0_9SPHI|nr:hypothetical protein [Daejeonella lutea]SKB76530.1 hypothetical protein SAMN05661099_2724 [Daejeonella lutea]
MWGRKWRWVVYLLGLIAALLTVFAVYLNYRWKPILTGKIKTAIQTSTNGLYSISFENIRTNIISGRISVKNIVFTPDTSVFTKMGTDSLAPRHLYSVQVSELTLKRVHPWKIYFDGMLEMGSVVIDKPKLQVIFTNAKRNKETTAPDVRTVWQRLSPYLRSLKVQDITFQDADFQYVDRSTSPARTTNLKGLTIRVSDLLIDSLSQFDKSRLYHTRDIYAELNSYKSVTADSNYTIQIQQFTASTAKGYARIKGLKLVPRYGEMEFANHFKVQKDRYSASIEEAQLNNIDYGMLNLNRRLLATNLTLKKADLSIFLNRSMPDSLRDRGMNFPTFSLQRFELDSKVDTVHLLDSRVNYSEYNPDSRRKGTVIFSKINGHILNVTNDSASLAKNTKADAKLTALLMDRGRFNVNMQFDLASPIAAFNFKGDVGRMDADMFNAAIRPLSLIEIKSGSLQRMEFNGSGSTKGVRGLLTCYYNHLKIALLERSEKTTWLKRRGIASIFANVLIIESDNPSPGRPVRKVSFNYARPAHSSFFNMIWKGMSSALLGSIGLDSETQREIKSRLQRMEIERFRREERRDEREKRKVKRRYNRRVKNQ